MFQQFSRLSISSQQYLFTQIGDSQMPSQFHESEAIERLDCMLIQNFKSFDKKYVGPFLNFTCIIGPNGSGKSNILDALMFAFCSQNSKHALIDARELINRQGKQSFKQLSKQNKLCSVEVTFILKNGQKFVINRTLDADNNQQYLVNYKNVNKKVYQNLLMRKGINCNCPNYAIWQGQIDRLILKDPIQLTNLIQNISGSVYFKKPYEQIKQKLKQVQSTIEQRTRKMNKLKIDKKNLKSVKQTSEQYSKYDQQYQQTLKKLYLLQVLEREKNLQSLCQEVKSVADQERIKLEQINQLKVAAQQDYNKKLELQEQLNKLMNQIATNYSKLKDIGNPANVLKVQKLKEAQEQMQRKNQEKQQLAYKRKSVEQAIPQIPPSSLIQEYLGLYEDWQTQNSALHREILKKNNQLLFVQGILQSKSDIIKQFQVKKEKRVQKMEDKKKNISNLNSDLKVISQSIKLMQQQVSKISRQAQKSKEQYEKKNKSFEQVCLSIQNIENLISQQAQDENQAQVLKSLASIDGFQGALHQKINPTAPKYDICFLLLFNTSSKYLLCQNQASSRKIGDRLKQLRLMKNVIILENVVERRTADIRKSLGKDGVMALDIVDYDKNVKGLKEYLSQSLYGKIVCQNLTAAYKIRSKNIDGLKEIYTLDGNIIKKDGSISSYGNIEALKKNQKYHNNKSTIYQDLSKLSKQKTKLQNELNTLKMRFEQKYLVKQNLQIEQLNRKKQEMIGKLKQLQSQQQTQIKIPPSIISQIKQLERQRDKISKSLIQIEKMLKSSKIFDKFLIKHKIQNLQAFRNANNFQHVENLLKKKNQSLKQINFIDSTVQKLQKQIKKLETQSQNLKNEVKDLEQLKNKGKFEKQISQKQKQMVNVRNKLSKLSNISRNQLTFQSNLPTLEAKLNFAKQKIKKQLEDFAYQLGVQFRYPIPIQQISKQLNLPKKVTDKVLESLGEKLQQQKLRIQNHLDKHNSLNLLINVKQDEQKIQSGMNGLIDQIQQILKTRKKLTQQLQSLRSDRSTIFNQFLIPLKQYLAQSYSLLTEQEDGSKGTVILHVQNEEEPFEHGIYFTPTPPTKRFVYDLEQLSGGERSIASLALQYSLSMASKSPILVLDQTDAFLDMGNVGRFLRLIHRGMEDRDQRVQFIVITHKQGLFCKSESLVGVSRPKSLNLSQVYSLKL